MSIFSLNTMIASQIALRSLQQVQSQPVSYEPIKAPLKEKEKMVEVPEWMVNGSPMENPEDHY